MPYDATGRYVEPYEEHLVQIIAATESLLRMHKYGLVLYHDANRVAYKLLVSAKLPKADAIKVLAAVLGIYGDTGNWTSSLHANEWWKNYLDWLAEDGDAV